MSDPRDVVAAVDVGGTRVKAALVARPMEVIAELTAPTPYDIDKAFGAAIAEFVSGLVSTAAARVGPVRLVGCGVVVPGLVDEEAGVGRLSVNLRWRDLPIRDVVAARTGVPTAVGHDVRAGLLAETRLGAARGVRNAVFIAIGTGIAGALMLDGAVVSADGWAGELGHVVVDRGGPPMPLWSAGLPGNHLLSGLGGARVRRRGGNAAVGRGDRVTRRGRGSGGSTRVGSRGHLARFRRRHDRHPDRGRVGAPRRRPQPERRHTPDATTQRCQWPTHLAARAADRAGGARRPSRDSRRGVYGLGCVVIIAVTPNAALDVTYEVDELKPQHSHRVRAVHQRAGGKGVNVASVLALMGHEVVAMGFAGGTTGAQIRADLDSRGLRHRLVECEGESRRTINVVSAVNGEATIFNEPGPEVSATRWQELLDKLCELVDTTAGAVVVLSGSLPRGLAKDAYAEMITLCRGRGARAIVDTSGAPLLSAISAGPDLAKPNTAEALRGCRDSETRCSALPNFGAWALAMS